MIYIENICNDPHYNLALEEHAFNHLCREEPILLLWQNEPSVIIGRYQNTVEEINTDYIEQNGVNVVRRITGGGAVYHDLGNLNYSFIIPNTDLEINFKTFSRPLVKALGKMGVIVEQTGRNDITVDGKKISGNAQFVNKRCLLHHGTILYDSRLEDVQKALAVKEGKIASKGIKSVRSRVTNIRPFMKDDIDIMSFKERLLHEFFHGENVCGYRLTEQQQAEIRELADTKYRTWEWNYGNSPKSDITRERYFPGGYIKAFLDIKDGLVANMKIYGDFFGQEDMADFEAAFLGKQYCRSSVAEVLNELEIERFFHNIKREELEELLY